MGLYRLYNTQGELLESREHESVKDAHEWVLQTIYPRPDSESYRYRLVGPGDVDQTYGEHTT